MNSVQYLLSIETRGIKLGLQRTLKLMAACGNPQSDLPSIQVAGTNGKGSVSAILANIFKTSNCNFINIQYGDVKEEINNFYSKYKIEITTIENLDLYKNLVGVAGLLKNLDLFISVSNTTAHLSAALGVTTWIIKPRIHAVFHYWNQPNKLSTPWYSSIRLFSYENGWGGTIQEIKKELLIKFNL